MAHTDATLGKVTLYEGTRWSNLPGFLLPVDESNFRPDNAAMFEALTTRIKALAKGAPAVPGAKQVATGKGSVPAGSGGMLPPVQNPNVKPGQVSFPDYVKSTTPQTSRLPQTDLQLANTDLVGTYRQGQTTYEVIRNLCRANPDLSAAVSAYLRVGIPEHYIALARGPDGTVDDDGTRLAMEILSRFDKMPGYATGFTQVDSMRSTSEALAKEAICFGGMSLELVLDQTRMPYKFQPVSVVNLKFYQDDLPISHGVRPVQLIGGIEVDLNLATFFMVYVDPSLADPYTQSPMEAAIQPILGSSQFLNDLRRVMSRHVHPRYDITINEEKLRDAIPAEILNDPEKLPGHLNSVLSGIEQTINQLSVEDALLHYDFVTVQYIKNDDGVGVAEKFKVIKDILDAALAKGARTLPAILGNDSGTQTAASTDTLLFMLSANSMVRLKLQELYSKALTLAVRLYGLDVTVEFEYDPIELKPEGELEAFRAMYHSRIKDMWSMGLIGDMEASLRLTHKPVPAGFKTLTGTYFMTGGDPNGAQPQGPDLSNPTSGTSTGSQPGGQGAANARKPTTPTKPKS